jgi:hypothetical protein
MEKVFSYAIVISSYRQKADRESHFNSAIKRNPSPLSASEKSLATSASGFPQLTSQAMFLYNSSDRVSSRRPARLFAELSDAEVVAVVRGL